jgi:hypothetical protein
MKSKVTSTQNDSRTTATTWKYKANEKKIIKINKNK